MGYKLDPEAKKQVLAVVAVGGTLKMAAQMVGCTERAIYYAAQQEPEFEREIKKQRNKAELACLEAMTAAAQTPNNWSAALCFLRMLDPDRYARRAELMPVSKVRHWLKEFTEGLSDVVTNPQSRLEIGNYVQRCVDGLSSREPPESRDLPPHRAATAPTNPPGGDQPPSTGNDGPQR